MKIIKPLLVGVLFWVLIATEVAIIGMRPELAAQTENGFVFNPTGMGVHFFLLSVITTVVAFFVFRKKSATAINGVKLGLVVVAVGLLLDIIITVPMFVKSYPFYFGKWTIWAGYALAVAVMGIGAMLFSKKE